MATNPCYDTVTHTDCPDRHAYCGVACPKWKAYVEERSKVYDHRKDQQARNAYVSDRMTKSLRKRRGRY